MNNQSANLPGQHWMAVSIHANGRAYFFDSFGMPPPAQLIKQLINQLHVSTPIDYNTIQYQNPLATDCGDWVLKYIRKTVAETR